MSKFSHSDAGDTREVASRLSGKIAELRAEPGGTRHQTVLESSLGGVHKILSGLPAKSQSTITVDVDERFTGDTHEVTKLYVDITVVPEAKEPPAEIPAVADAASSSSAPVAGE